MGPYIVAARASRRRHGSVRGCVDHTSRPAAEHARALRRDRRARANVAGVLHRIPGHESYPVPFAATIEHGALSIAACRPGNSERRRDCPNLSIPGAGALRSDLPHHLRGNALVDTSKKIDQKYKSAEIA